jgi:integrase
MNYVKATEVDTLLETNSHKVIEAQLIDYIMSLRQDSISYSTIKYLVAPIFTFYQLNDILLNKKKVFRYLGEFKRVVKDKAYTIEQIRQSLQNADQRMRMIILLLASTGCRIGALPALTLGNLTKIPDYGLYKITFYEGTNNEYYSFCTRETAQTGIESYLLYRQRCGEKISFSQDLNRWEPEDTPLIRLSFDGTDSLQASRQVKPMPYKD